MNYYLLLRRDVLKRYMMISYFFIFYDLKYV